MTLRIELRERLKEVGRPRALVQRHDRQGRRARRCASTRRSTAPTATARFELYPNVNVGVAVAAQDTLVVPTVFDADQKSLGEIARQRPRR